MFAEPAWFFLTRQTAEQEEKSQGGREQFRVMTKKRESNKGDKVGYTVRAQKRPERRSWP